MHDGPNEIYVPQSSLRGSCPFQGGFLGNLSFRDCVWPKWGQLQTIEISIG